jgi:hypothetical protein
MDLLAALQPEAICAPATDTLKRQQLRPVSPRVDRLNPSDAAPRGRRTLQIPRHKTALHGEPAISDTARPPPGKDHLEQISRQTIRTRPNYDNRTSVP